MTHVQQNVNLSILLQHHSYGADFLTHQPALRAILKAQLITILHGFPKSLQVNAGIQTCRNYLISKKY